MRRGKAVLPGIAVLAVLATGCSGTSGIDGGGADPKPGETRVAAAPGKYHTLPEPCASAAARRLKAMLPVLPSLPSEQQQEVYEGKADVSYDGDRRVGCRWKAEGEDATRLLFVGYERVVSYDPATSDDDKAKEVYERQLAAAHLPEPPAPTPTASATTGGATTGAPGATASGTATTGATTAGTPAGGSPSGAPSGSPSGSPGASGSPGGPPPEGPDLGSRVLDDLGDAAFLEDRTNPAGPSSQARTVRIVFRASNVIVTVEYAVQPTVPALVPDPEETQDRARQLASDLADGLSE
ncbi:DUF3558 domain-containing protein [Streptomyces sp. NPDC089919]|uniref:DUF3558 domain-containing protein n=1 Tax=Streptomyces sp. NPDC089919 TaxID=3155188 RepID=UPI003441A17A